MDRPIAGCRPIARNTFAPSLAALFTAVTTATGSRTIRYQYSASRAVPGRWVPVTVEMYGVCVTRGLLPRAAVGSLIAIQGATAQEFLIGMRERATRQIREQTAQPDSLAPTSFAIEG